MKHFPAYTFSKFLPIAEKKLTNTNFDCLKYLFVFWNSLQTQFVVLARVQHRLFALSHINTLFKKKLQLSLFLHRTKIKKSMIWLLWTLKAHSGKGHYYINKTLVMEIDNIDTTSPCPILCRLVIYLEDAMLQPQIAL